MTQNNLSQDTLKQINEEAEKLYPMLQPDLYASHTDSLLHIARSENDRNWNKREGYIDCATAYALKLQSLQEDQKELVSVCNLLLNLQGKRESEKWFDVLDEMVKKNSAFVDIPAYKRLQEENQRLQQEITNLKFNLDKAKDKMYTYEEMSNVVNKTTAQLQQENERLIYGLKEIQQGENGKHFVSDWLSFKIHKLLNPSPQKH